MNKQIVVITGSSGGFGYATAQAFLQAGAIVIISSRNQNHLELAEQQLKTLGDVSRIRCDVTSLKNVQELAAFVIKKFGGFDVWINNAGISGPYGPTLMTDPQVFRSVCNTNIIGTYHGSITALQHFNQKGKGKLINILGMGFKQPAPFQNAYGASKNWIRVFTQSLAKENADFCGVGIFFISTRYDGVTDLITNINVIDGFQNRVKVFPKVVEYLAVDPALPSQKNRQYGSAQTGKVRRTGKLIITTAIGNYSCVYFLEMHGSL